MTQNVSEQVGTMISDKTVGLLSFSCLTKDFRNCMISVDFYDSLGKRLFSEVDVDARTYKINFLAPGDFKVSFYNKDV